MLLLTRPHVTALLTMRECIEVMADALGALARGEALLPLRQVMHLPSRKAAFALMPAYLGSERALGAKAITVFPDNHGTALDSHQGAVLLFEADRGALLAVMDAGAITAIRTAAVSAVATRALAREDAAELAVIGSGVQAASHIDAMALVRPVRRVRVWSRDPERVRAFTARMQERSGVPVEPADSARDAVESADILCTTSAAREPVVRGEWIAEGAHVNAVGASVPTARELDSAAVARARLFVDRRESALAEAGDFLIPHGEGLIGDDHIVGELGDVLVGRCRGRRSTHEITLFKSLGLAVEDVAAARHVYAKAIAVGAGTHVDWTGADGDAHA